MNVIRGLIIVGVLMLSSVLIAQSVDGTWTGEVQGGRGTPQVTLTLKADGGKLTGSVGGGRGGEIAFSRMADGGQGQAQEFTLKRRKETRPGHRRVRASQDAPMAGRSRAPR